MKYQTEDCRSISCPNSVREVTRVGRVQSSTCSVGAPTRCKVSGSTVFIVTTVSVLRGRGGVPGKEWSFIIRPETLTLFTCTFSRS